MPQDIILIHIETGGVNIPLLVKLMHIDFFGKSVMQKGSDNIHVMKRPSIGNSQGDDSA